MEIKLDSLMTITIYVFQGVNGYDKSAMQEAVFESELFNEGKKVWSSHRCLRLCRSGHVTLERIPVRHVMHARIDAVVVEHCGTYRTFLLSGFG